MIDHSQCNFDRVSIHRVNGEVRASEEPVVIHDDTLRETMMRFFLSPFRIPEFYSVTDSSPLHQAATEIFEHNADVHIQSIKLAQHLFSCSQATNIKAGDFCMAAFPNLQVDGEYVDAIGLFKCENKELYLKMSHRGKLQTDEGIPVDKLDKGCLIFNVAEGYRLCLIDRLGKGQDARYWKDEFLQAKPCEDSYHHTRNYLSVARDFVTKQLDKEFEVSKADQAALLNKSVEYFKTNDQFDEEEFTASVFEDREVIGSFKRFREEKETEGDFSFEETFDISVPAVKNSARVFKSVLKLDRNFSVYVHGNRNMIEKGVDENGRKYYKLYYENES